MDRKSGKKRQLEHVEKMEKLFEYIAYGSLLIDFGIAGITFFSANSSTATVAGMQALLNYAVTAVLIVSAVLFTAIKIMTHYERIIDGLARVGLSNSRRRGQKRL